MYMLLKQFIFILLITSGVSGQAVASEMITIGWLENVRIDDSEYRLKAKIDTGADNSSINAEDVIEFSKEGEQWVKFSLRNAWNKHYSITKPVIKTTRIKMKNGNVQQRFVIELEVRLGKISKLVKVNLVDRSHFKYQLLIGRSFLGPQFLVDSSRTFTVTD